VANLRLPLGNRVGIPSHKALMVKQGAHKVSWIHENNQGGLLGGHTFAFDVTHRRTVQECRSKVSVTNGTVIPTIAVEKTIQMQAITNWKEGVLNAQNSTDGSGMISWADEVKHEMATTERKQLILEKFDIKKIYNT
ncbi:hypothetical protein HAX54_028272, partial [Datura stramonium]|nr:hypothetical protein [Datura stramonium]